VELRRMGKTIIFSTHMMESAERMCDAVCIISRGEKVLDGKIGEVRAEHGAQHVVVLLDGASRNGATAVFRDPELVRRVDESNRFFEIELMEGADPQRLLRQLLDDGAVVTRFELVQPSLHQIFLQKVGVSGTDGRIEQGLTDLG